MALAIFDLDNTLIGGDSDHAWGQFVSELGAVDKVQFQRQNDLFLQHYKKGELDISAYQLFVFDQLKDQPPETLNEWHRQFMATKIAPMQLNKARQLLEKHRKEGDYLLIITATIRFVTEPIAKQLRVDDLLASEGEMINGRYTGKPTGIPCFQEGKVERLQNWLKENKQELAGSYFYSDSHNDLPLLKVVDNPVAVDPDETLKNYAEENGWPVISLRD